MYLKSGTLAIGHVTGAAFEWLVVRTTGGLRLTGGGLLKGPLHFMQVGDRVIVN